MRILIVDDEVKLTDALSYILKKNKYLVDIANDGISGYDLAESNIYDVIILDIMLPYKDGMTILKDLRKQGIMTPVIMLTAKNSLDDRIEGLDRGADDYLSKPFATDELLARIRAVSRRKDKKIDDGEKIVVKNIELYPRDCQIKCLGKIIKLTLKETQILEVLMNNFNITLTRDQLIDKIWGFEKDVEMNNIEAHICYLRKKIDFKKNSLELVTVRGLGYALKEK